MTKRTKNILITILLLAAFIQGPFFYYFTEGFIKLILLSLFAFTCLLITVIALVKIVRYKSSTSLFHVMGLTVAFIIGVSTLNGSIMEYFDFTLRKSERIEIIKKLKDGTLKRTDSLDSKHSHGYVNKGIVSVTFYIDRGFIDHYSAFFYTDDPEKIKALNKAEGTSSMGFIGAVKKLEDNWYRISY